MTELRWAGDGSDGAVAAHVAARRGSTVAMPGGSTPAAILPLLRGWSGTIWPTDERLVPPDHPASNRRALVEAFPEAEVAALAEGQVPPHFDLVWLGMGGDGHIASLFPSCDPDPLEAAAVVRVQPDPLPPEAPFERLSLNLAALAGTHDIILVIRGEAKRALLAEAAAGSNDLPVARLLRMAAAPVTVFWSPA